MSRVTVAGSDGDVTAPGLDVTRLRRDFPALHQQVQGKPLIYLDNAATAHKPQAVIEALHRSSTVDNANVHRGIHTLSERATQAYEDARDTVQQFINAADRQEIIFVRGTTEAINLVAQSYGRTFLGANDEIIISALEHHSNIVPWQILCEQMGAKLCIVPMDQRGELVLAHYEAMLSPRTKFVALSHVSNALGTINPIKYMIDRAHRYGIPVLIDGAQAIPHLPVDVQALDCDFYAFSGHKLYGPTGIGVLYGKAELLDQMPPYQGGGDMISMVTFEKTHYNRLPYKFEAGTPHIAGVVGLGAAIAYVQQRGLDRIAAHESALLASATTALATIPGLRVIGTAQEKACVLSFVLDGIHPHDIGTVLDQAGIAIRAGHHCAMPVMQWFGVPATARASFGLYNTHQEVAALVEALQTAREVFG